MSESDGMTGHAFLVTSQLAAEVPPGNKGIAFVSFKDPSTACA